MVAMSWWGRRRRRQDDDRAAAPAPAPVVGPAPASPTGPAPAPTAAPPAVTGVLDPAVAAELAEVGFVRLGQFLDPDEVAAARAVFTRAASRLDRPIGETWFPTILLPETDVRDEMNDGLRSLIEPRLASVFDRSQLDLMRIDYSVKPASPDSELGAHQDFALIDEDRWTSLYFWIPLSDSDERNGTLHVLPRSHRFANRVRSQHVPAVFDEVLDLVRGHSVRLDCAAGELVVMVSGVVHWSPPNRSDELRLAAHGIVKPIDAPLVFFYADDRTPPDAVECYELDMESYVRHIVAGRPDDGEHVARLVPRPPSSMTPERFRTGMLAAGGRLD
jgi:hypothetical protein